MMLGPSRKCPRLISMSVLRQQSIHIMQGENMDDLLIIYKYSNLTNPNMGVKMSVDKHVSSIDELLDMSA